MKYLQQHQAILACIAGIVIAYTAGIYLTAGDGHFPSHEATDEYHIHADTLIVINGEIVDLSSPQFMSSINQILHPDAHYHDASDDILHLHAEGISLAEFYRSLGVTLTDTCISTPDGTSYCSDDTNQLLLYSNGTQITAIAEYVPNDTDRLLVYYGPPDAEAIASFNTQITDAACIYSGTCPLRGTPPPESCGLTCEI